MENENPTIKDLYPHYSDEELEEADRQLRAYARVIWKVAEQLELDPEKLKEFERFKKGYKKRPPTDL